MTKPAPVADEIPGPAYRFWREGNREFAELLNPEDGWRWLERQAKLPREMTEQDLGL